MPVLKKRGLHYVLITVALMCAVLAALWLYRVDPEDSVYSPKCLFYLLTGLKCPGCGSQRAIHSLLHLDIAAAFGYNALLVIALPAVAMLVYCELTRTRKPRLYSAVNSPRVTWTMFATVMLWWVVRNIAEW